MYDAPTDGGKVLLLEPFKQGPRLQIWALIRDSRVRVGYVLAKTARPCSEFEVAAKIQKCSTQRVLETPRPATPKTSRYMANSSQVTGKSVTAFQHGVTSYAQYIKDGRSVWYQFPKIDGKHRTFFETARTKRGLQLRNQRKKHRAVRNRDAALS